MTTTTIINGRERKQLHKFQTARIIANTLEMVLNIDEVDGTIVTQKSIFCANHHDGVCERRSWRMARTTVGECITARSLQPGECGPKQELQGLSPHASASRGGCPVGRPSQLEARKIRMRLESKGERKQMLFGGSGKGFSGSATCWWVSFLVDRHSRVSHSWRYLINRYFSTISSANSHDWMGKGPFILLPL